MLIFKDCGGWWFRRRVIGGKECLFFWVGFERGTGVVFSLFRFWFSGEFGEDFRGGFSVVEVEGFLDDIVLIVFRFRRRVFGEIVFVRVLVICGGVCILFVCLGGCFILFLIVLLFILFMLELGFRF